MQEKPTTQKPPNGRETEEKPVTPAPAKIDQQQRPVWWMWLCLATIVLIIAVYWWVEVLEHFPPIWRLVIRVSIAVVGGIVTLPW